MVFTEFPQSGFLEGPNPGAAVAYTAWVRRAAAHPEIAAALAAGKISESVARTICSWTDKLPQDCQEDADAILLGAAAGGADLRDLAMLAGEIYGRSLPKDKDQDKDDGKDKDEDEDEAFDDGPSGWRRRSRARGWCTGT